MSNSGKLAGDEQCQEEMWNNLDRGWNVTFSKPERSLKGRCDERSPNRTTECIFTLM